MSPCNKSTLSLLLLLQYISSNNRCSQVVVEEDMGDNFTDPVTYNLSCGLSCGLSVVTVLLYLSETSLLEGWSPGHGKGTNTGLGMLH